MSIRILGAEETTYITNKVINNQFRAEDANLSSAGTIDLFKLFEESSLPGTGSTDVVELSRALLKFDLDPLRKLTGSILNLNNFSCSLNMTTVRGGNTVPNNVRLIIFPLSKSFDEGTPGRDVESFSDIGTPNWLTASIDSLTPLTWSVSGANGLGIDYITGTNELGNLHGVQFFKKGTEDLSIDITKIVSSTLTEQIEDHGFRLSLSSSYEEDQNSYFAFRFASKHATDPNIRPRLLVRFDDSIQDHSNIFFFDLSGSLFLNNYHRGQPANILSGTSLTQITGTNSLILKLESGSFSKVITGSQHQINGNNQKGIYSASFAISSEENSALRQEIRSAGSASFDAIWSSLDETQPFLSSSLVIRSINRSSFTNTQKKLIFSFPNLRSQYSQNEKAKIKIQAFDVDEDVKFSKLPIERKPVVLNKLYYRIRDIVDNSIIIPFDADGTDELEATLCSSDSDGNNFTFWASDLPLGRTYTIDLLNKERGVEQTYDNLGISFRVSV